MSLLRRVFQKLGVIPTQPGAEFPTSRNISIGQGSYYDRNCTFVARDGGRIEIGKYCSIARGVTIININHDFERVSTYPFYTRLGKVDKHDQRDLQVGNVLIGNDVWIGANATILKDVVIGDGAVIGAGAVVTKPVPPYAIVAGNPASIIKYRFPEEQITSLQKIGWWDWTEEQIRDRRDDLYLPIAEFITKYG